MYIQITSKCKMQCSHCCYNCDINGEHMSFEIFERIIKYCSNRFRRDNQYIILGGGEPTEHPNFWKILDLSLENGFPWISTNGQNSNDVFKLLELAKNNKIKLALSLDKWHKKIDENIVEEFKKGMVKKEYDNIDIWLPDIEDDGREIRTLKEPIKIGRCQEGSEECLSGMVHIYPNGIMKYCGCEDSKIVGDFSIIEDGFFSEYKNINWYEGCHKK